MTREQAKALAPIIAAYAEGATAEYNSANDWFEPAEPTFSPACKWRIKPKPKTRPWSKPEDVPGPVCWVRHKGTVANQLIAYIGTVNITFGGSMMYWSQLENYEYSTDRKTWHPCTVEESV